MANESTEWLYKQLTKKGYNVGKDQAEFDNLMSTNAESRQWAYDTARKHGLNVGKDIDEFTSLVAPSPAPAEKQTAAGEQTSGAALMEEWFQNRHQSHWQKAYEQEQARARAQSQPSSEPVQKPKAAPAATQQPAWKTSAQDKIRMMHDVNAVGEGFNGRMKTESEKLDRIVEQRTPEGMRKRKAAEDMARVAGKPMRVEGAPDAGLRPTYVPEPQEYGVTYVDGKPQMQWLMPDGSLTTNKAEAYVAETGRMNQQFVDRMKGNGLDPAKSEDIEKQMQFDAQAPVYDVVAKLWQEAEAKHKADKDLNAKREWDMYAALGGGKELRTATAASNTHANNVSRMKRFDLEKMMNDVWTRTGADVTRSCYYNLRRLYPSTSNEELQKAASQMARQLTCNAVYQYAVKKNTPKSTLEYFGRTIADMNILGSITKGLARSQAGASGDLAASEAAMEEYGENHRVAQIAGTVAGMAVDPVAWVSGGVGSASGKLATNLGGRYVAGKAATSMSKEVGQRLFANSLSGRIITGSATGAGNFMTYETLKEGERQFVHGGHINPKTGENEGYSALEVLKAAGHGVVMGGVTGVITPAFGNVADKVVKSTSSTAGKAGVRVGEFAVSKLAEGTVFSVPEWISGERGAMDVWSDNMGMMIGFGAQHVVKSAPKVIAGLRPVKPAEGRPLTQAERRHNNMDFMERLNKVLDVSAADMDFTAGEREELRRAGYGKLTDLFSRDRKTETNRGEVDGEQVDVETVGGNPEFDGYSEMERLVQDRNVSQAARAKAYYRLTGRTLPMGTVTGYTSTKDENGRVTVNSVTADGEVVTSRTFKDEKGAKGEINDIMRQAELNSVDVGERYAEAVADEMVLDAAVGEVSPGADAETVKGIYRAVKSGAEGVSKEQVELAAKIDDAVERNRTIADENRPEAHRKALKEESGVDVDDALRKSPGRRNKKEQEAVKTYLERLFPEEAREKAQPTPEQEGTREQYEQGRLLFERYEQGDMAAQAEADAIALRVREAEKLVDEAFGAEAKYYAWAIHNTELKREQREAVLWELLERSELTEEQRDAVLYYVNAKAAMDGAVDASNEAADRKRAEVSNSVKLRTHKDKGVIIPAETVMGKQVYIVTGDIVMNSDGKGVDRSKSDGQIFILNPETGKYESSAPEFIERVLAPMDPQEELEAAMEAIEQERNMFAPAEQDAVPDQPESVPNSEEMSQNPEENAVLPAESVPNPATPVENEQETPAPTAEQTPLQRLPRDEKGEPVFEQAESPESGWDALVEFSEGDAATAKEIADTMAEDKRKALEKAQKQKAKGKTPSEIFASKKEIVASLAQAEQEYNLWQQMAGVEQRRQEAVRAQQEAEARRLVEERAAEEKAERDAREEAARKEREALEGIPEWHLDTPENARKRGTRRFGGQMYTRQEPVQGAAGKDVEVKFSKKDLPKGRMAVIEAPQLQPSHIQGQRNPMFFIEEAQPKNRAEAVSMYAAKEMAEGIRPQEITEGTTAYTGAPTVNARGEVIQGNNRSDALRYLWDNNLPEQQQAYKQYLIDNAERFGLDPEAVNAMQQPVLVNMLDVDDAEAIRLGQMTAQDTESGGIERIKPKNVAQKLGEDMRAFAAQLLQSGDEEASFGQLVDRNGAEVMKWMSQRGAITDTQYQSAFDSKGNLTAEAKNDLQKVLYQAVFKGGSQQLEEMFDALPAKAQRSILSTAFRDMDSPQAGKMLPEIQASVAAYQELMNEPAFAGAKKLEDALRAVETFRHVTALDDRFEQYMPADNFSNFALHLAAMYKASDMSQSTIAGYFNQMYDLAQGKKEATLFEEADATEYPLAEVVKKVLNIDYQPAKNGNKNVRNGSASLAGSDKHGETGQSGDGELSSGGEQNPSGTEPSVSGAGTEKDRRGSGERGNRQTDRERQRDLQASETNNLNYSLSDEVDENGRQFVLNSKGEIEFGRIGAETGLTSAPILLSEGIITSPTTNDGYGLLHIEARHGAEIRKAGYPSVLAFIEDVANRWEVIKEAKDRNGNQTYRLIAQGKHNHTLMVELSGDGTYWNINTAGVFKTTYGKNQKEVYVRHTTDKRPAEDVGESQISEQSGTTENSRMNSPALDMSESLLPNSSEWHLTEHPTDVPDLLPTQGKSDAKEMYAKLNDIRQNDTSSEGGGSSISHADNAAPAISLESRGDVISRETDAKTEPQQPNNAVSSDSSLSTDEQSGTSSIEPNGESTVSERKVNDSASEKQEGGAESFMQGSDSERKSEPSEAQKEAGNYKMEHRRVDGYNISIENAKGSVRRGIGADGKPWETTMQNDYGYIRGTEGVDGDHIDVFLSDAPEEGDVFVVDQVNEGGSFDEHKVMYGFATEQAARDAYLSNYEPGWTGLGAITHVSKDEFKKWIQSSRRKTKPFADYATIKKAVSAKRIAEFLKEKGYKPDETKFSIGRGTKRNRGVYEAAVGLLKSAGVEVVEVSGKEAQLMLEQTDGDVQLMGSRTDRKMARIAEHYAGKELDGNQQAVVDVFSGKRDNVAIEVERADGKRRVIMRQGNERKAGTRHSLFRHFGTQSNYVTADDIAMVPEIIVKGERIVNDKKVAYEYTAEDGTRLKVTTETGDGREKFTNFLSNRKPLLSDRVENTQLSAHSSDAEVSDAKVGKNNEADKQKYLKTPDGTVYGWVADGKVFLNRDAMNPETPLHEYTHLWDEMVRRENPELWERGKELMKQTPVWDEVMKDPNYADLHGDEDAVASEVHSRLTGRDGARLMQEMIDSAKGKGVFETAKAVSLVERLKRWLSDMFKSLKKTLGKWSKRDLDNLAAEDFARMTIRDLAEGMNPRGGEMTPGKARFQIIGERGAERLDRAEEARTRLDNLATARKMEAEKKDAGKIRIATGWERGADGLWRYEVPDFDVDPKGLARKNSLWVNLPWGKEYERLADKVLDGEELSGEESAQFDELSERAEEMRRAYEESEVRYLDDYVKDESLFTAYPGLKQIKVEMYSDSESEVGGTYYEKENLLRLNEKLFDAGDLRSVLTHEVQHAIQAEEGFARGGRAGNTSDAAQSDGRNTYDSLSGEVEARNAQRRMGMSEEERRKTLLRDTEDVSREDQIFIDQHLIRPDKANMLSAMSRGRDDFDAIRARAVAERGIVMPGLKEKEVRVVDVPRHDFSGTGRQAIEKARDWSLQHLVGEHWYHKGRKDGFKFEIDEDAIGKYLSSSSTKGSDNLGIHLAALKSLPEIIDSSIEAEIHADYAKSGGKRMAENGIQNPDILIHRYYGAARIDGKPYRVKTTIKETSGGDVAPYNYQVTELELLISGSETSDALSNPNRLDVAKLLKGVEKSYDPGKKLLDDGEKSDREGDARSREASEAAMTERVQELSERLNLPVRILRTPEEIKGYARNGREAGAKGLTRIERGGSQAEEIAILLPNNSDVADVENTFMHEGLGHDGLRMLFPTKELLDNALDELYRVSNDAIRTNIDGMARGIYEAEVGRMFSERQASHGGAAEANANYYADMAAAHREANARREEMRREATEEYGARLAGKIGEAGFERMSAEERTFWGKLRGLLQKAFENLLRGLKIPRMRKWTDRQWAYIWHKAYKMKKANGRMSVVDEAEDIVMRRRTGWDDAMKSESAKLEDMNNRFNRELQHQIEGTLPNGHIYQLGNPGTILRSTGVPNLPIQMSATRLRAKATEYGHDFDLAEIKNLVKELQTPMAVFAYGDKGKMQNIIVGIESNGKQFIVGLSLNPIVNGKALEINSVRNVFPKNNAEWLNWISQGKLLYADKEKIQALIDKQRTILADVDYLDLEGVAKIIKSFENPTIDGEENAVRFRDGADYVERTPGVGIGEVLAKMKAEAVKANTDNLMAKRKAIRAIDANLNQLRQAMARQREYDITTVKSVADLARVFMDFGLLNDLSNYEIKRILSSIQNSIGHLSKDKDGIAHVSGGKKNYMQQVNNVINVIVDNQLRSVESTFGRLLSTRGSKVDARGIQVQGKLDPNGQMMLKAYKNAVSLPAESYDSEGNLRADCIEALIKDALNRMGDLDPRISENATAEYAGLRLAKIHAETITESKNTEKLLRKEISKAEEQAKGGTLDRKAFRQFEEATEESIQAERIKRIHAYEQLIDQLEGALGESAAHAKAWQESERARVNRIYHLANSDMQGRELQGQRKDKRVQNFSNNWLVRAALAPLSNFDQMLKMFGRQNANGEGYLHDNFMRHFIDSTDREQLLKEEYQKKMDDKVAEIFGKGKKYVDLYHYANTKPSAEITYYDGADMRKYELSQDALLYLYAVEKMPIGKATNRRMGISDETIKQITDVLDPKLKEYADWTQEKLLPELGIEADEVYQRMFGAHMDAIENYFPFVRDKEALKREVENGRGSQPNDRISVQTGAIKKRTPNVVIWNLKKMSFFDVNAKHVAEISHWMSFAELNRDLGTLLSYNRFKQQVKGMSSAYGAGDGLWERFCDVCAIATDAYDPGSSMFDRAMITLTKGVTIGKIAFRPFTALKQTLSLPAFFGDVNVKYLAYDLTTGGIPAMKWAWKNMPNFRKRILSRTTGDYRLRETEYDSKIMKASTYGMFPNIGVDAWTIAIGAHGAYRTNKDKYLRWGMDEAKAERRAIQDAEMCFNKSQQSSEGAYLAPIQVNHTFLANMAMLFRNSSNSYTRETHNSARNLKRLASGEANEEFMAKQILRTLHPEAEGAWTEEQWSKAHKNAKRELRSATVRNSVNLAIYGWILPWLWRIGGIAPLLLLSSDDNEKQEQLIDTLKQSAFAPIEGINYGDVIEDMLNVSVGLSDKEQLGRSNPMIEDIAQMWKHRKDWALCANDVLNIIGGMCTGVNPQTFTDWAVAIMDATDDRATQKETALLVARLFNCPQSHLEKVYFEELDMNALEASRLTPKEIAERYAEYKMHREAPLTGWMRSTETSDSIKERKVKRVLKDAKGRLEARTNERANVKADWLSNYESVKARLSEIRKSKEDDEDRYYELLDELESTPAYEKYWIVRDYRHDIQELSKSILQAKNTEEMQQLTDSLVSLKRDMVRELQEAEEQ